MNRTVDLDRDTRLKAQIILKSFLLGIPVKTGETWYAVFEEEDGLQIRCQVGQEIDEEGPWLLVLGDSIGAVVGLAREMTEGERIAAASNLGLNEERERKSRRRGV